MRTLLALSLLALSLSSFAQEASDFEDYPMIETMVDTTASASSINLKHGEAQAKEIDRLKTQVRDVMRMEPVSGRCVLVDEYISHEPKKSSWKLSRCSVSYK